MRPLAELIWTLVYSGGRVGVTNQTVKADARAAKREIQRRTMTNNNKLDAKSSLGKPGAKPPVVNRPKRVELVNFRGVLVPKEVAICRFIGAEDLVRMIIFHWHSGISVTPMTNRGKQD